MTDSSGSTVYVYYRVRLADAAAAIAAVRSFQAGLAVALPGLRCRLAQRVEQGGELLTLMETYGHPGGLGTAWRLETESLAQTQLAPWTVGQRHVEVFEACA